MRAVSSMRRRPVHQSQPARAARMDRMSPPRPRRRALVTAMERPRTERRAATLVRSATDPERTTVRAGVLSAPAADVVPMTLRSEPSTRKDRDGAMTPSTGSPSIVPRRRTVGVRTISGRRGDPGLGREGTFQGGDLGQVERDLDGGGPTRERHRAQRGQRSRPASGAFEGGGGGDGAVDAGAGPVDRPAGPPPGRNGRRRRENGRAGGTRDRRW